MMDNLTVGEKIKNARKEHKMNQKQLAEKSGIIDTTIRKYEAGTQNPKLTNLQKIATALNISLSDLISLEKPEHKIDVLNGIKHDKDKIKMELLPLRELQEIAKVLTYGAKKYAPDNWKKVPDAKERYVGALLRHLTAWQEGETFDPEARDAELRYIAQVACNALFLLWEELEDKKEV